MLITLITGILLTSTGITYSIFLISKTSKNSNLVVGDIYMHYNETNQISLSNVMPSNTYTNDYFEFIIDGKNTTTDKDIWYEVVLSKGDNIDGKTRIKDNLLRFRLTETKDNKETIVVNNKSYSDLTSKRIWVDTINKNTINEVVHTYRLYMWISNDTVIGNVNQDYTMEEWKNIFASIKVNVTGDFNEKYILTEIDTTCFKTEENETGLTITDYNSLCGSKIAIPETIDNLKVTQISSNAFNNKGLIYVDIPSSVVKIGAYAFTGNNITSINVPETVTNLHCKAFDDGVVKNRDMTCGESCFTVGTINDGNEVAIIDYDKTCGTDVIIPRKIKGYPVTVIGNSYTAIVKQLSNKNNNYSFNNLNNYVNKKYKINKIDTSGGAFENKGLTSIIIPNTITTIEESAFYNNQLTSVTIPDSVTTIGGSAFSNNQLTSVEFSNPSKLERIEHRAFQNNNISTVSIPETVTYLECSAFGDTVVITKSDSLVCTNYIY